MSLLMVRKSAPAKAADAYIDDIAYKYKVGDKIKTPDGVGTVQKKTHTNSGTPAYEVKLDKGGIVVHVEQSVSAAHDSAPFRVGQKVKAKPEAARWPGYQGHALGNSIYTIKKVDSDGTVLLNEFLDVYVNAKNLVAADSAATDGAGYANYANARSAFAKAMFSATSAAMEILSAASGFEKDPQYNKEFEKMVKSDTDFARKFIALKNQFKV